MTAFQVNNQRPNTADNANERPAGPPPDDSLVVFPLTLRDGTIVQVRSIRADDDARLREFHARVSPDSIMFRYFRALPTLPDALVEHLTHVNYTTRMALVATVGSVGDEQIVAVVRYEGMAGGEAEVAFLVEDRWQGHGIATGLLHHLATYARKQGFTTFVADVMVANYHMREVLRNAGFPHSVRYDSGCIEERLDISVSPRASFRSLRDEPTTT